MLRSAFLLSSCVVLIAGIAGCGGNSISGGGGGGNPTTVTYTFTGVAPSTVATKIGTGAYTQASLSAGTLTINVPSGTTDYAVAYTCMATANFGENLEQIFQASVQDGTSFSKSCPATPATGVATVSVNASAIPGAAYVSTAGALQTWSGSTLTLTATVPTGTHDVAVEVSDQLNQILAIRILRSQTIPGALNGGNTVVFQASDETVPEPVTYSSIPSGFTVSNPIALYLSANGASAYLASDVSTQYSAMPPGSFQSGDYYLIAATAFNSNAPGESVALEDFTSSAGAQAFTFPAPWTYAGPAASASPTFSLDYTGFAGMPNVSQLAEIQWQAGTNIYDLISVFPSANYQSGATSIALPDLSGLTGFLIPPSGMTVFWNVAVFQGSPLVTTPPSGIVQSVQNNGTYTVP